MLKIITAPSEILSEKAVSVRRVDGETLKLIEEMKKTLLSAEDPEGVGLAAPQVGKPFAIFLIKPTPKSPIKVFINPKIIEEKNLPARLAAKRAGRQGDNSNSKKKKGRTKLEGCLSLPGIWGEVKRNPEITLSFLNEKGKKHIKTFKGFIATVIQHEADHLNGILFTERVLEQNGTLYKSHRNEKGEDVFEEIEL